MKRIIIPIVLFIITISLCGCYDSREIDETAYIIAVGIDTAENGEFSYTFQFAAPLAISGEGGGGEEQKSGNANEADAMLDSNNPGVKNTVIRAADFYVARNMLNNFLSKNIDMSHLKMIVFSSDIEAGDFILHSQLFRRERQVRPHTMLAAADGSAEEFLRCVNPELEANTAKYYELMSLRSNNIYAPSVRLYDFADRLAEGSGSVLPIAFVSRAKSSKELDKTVSANKNYGWISSDGGFVSSSKSELRGMMIFNNARLVGKMNGDNALIYNILNCDIKEFTLSLENKNKAGAVVTFNVKVPSAAKYTVEQKQNGGCTVIVRQVLEPRYPGNGLPAGYTSQDELMRDFSIAVSERMNSFFYSTSRDFGTDIMDTGNCVKKKCITMKDWDINTWNKMYKNAEFKCVIEL